MNQHLTDSRIANLGANAIHEAFQTYRIQFNVITRRAKARFEGRDWHGMQADAAERLDLYKKIVDQIVIDIRDLLETRLNQKLVWASIKAVFSGLITNRDDWELAETFFNSVTRRIFATVGVDPQIEFVDTDFESPPTQAKHSVYYTYTQPNSTAVLLKNILDDYRFQITFQDIERDVQLVTEEINAQLRKIKALRVAERAEMVKSVFYRGKGAYLVGRIYSGPHLIPLVLALINTPRGIVIDAVLLTEDEVSILFSFTRSYFHVEVDRPYDLAHFLKSIMPRKRFAELYISIGYNKHGKTEMYRDLLHHLAYSRDKFEIARGERGMVMVVFTMPTYDLVFKIIKDHFSYPKTTTRRDVMEKYHLVFNHDRAGRLVDAQEFEHLKIHRERFTEKALNELLQVAAQTVLIEADYVIIRHGYVERRLSPLNLYVREADEASARAAVIDYGNAIKDLMATNIFPGDLLLKNFGVTRHGRVVFYDYDELCLLTGCNFRTIPRATNFEDEFFAESWFTPDDNDIFPEEFRHFLGLPDDLKQIFIKYHDDLFEAEFWQHIQARLQSGEVIHIFPYDQTKRLQLEAQRSPTYAML